MADDYTTLSAAMAAGDELAEAEIRYKMLAEVFADSPQLRANLNPSIERVKAEILRLRAANKPKQDLPDQVKAGTVVQFDPSRFQKTAPARSKKAKAGGGNSSA